MSLMAEIIAKLDIRAIVEEFVPGKIVANKESNGWMQLHAVDREDRNPSASISLEHGYYRDFGNPTEGAITFFDFLARTGAFADWQDARKEMAKRAGIKLPAKDKLKKVDWDENWGTQIAYSTMPIEKGVVNILGFLKRKTGVTLEALVAFGAKRCQYNNLPDAERTGRVNSCIALPIFPLGIQNPFLAPLAGVVLYPSNGLWVYLHDGERKSINRGGTGVVGRHGLSILLDPEKRKNIDTVWKTEGPTDAMTLWASIPPEARDRNPVVTNACGAGENANLLSWATLLHGLNVAIVHDNDEAGQKGAINWIEKVAPKCRRFKNVQVMQGVQAQDCKDLRDWFNAGGTFDQLCAARDATLGIDNAEPEAIPDLPEDERVLQEIGCEVLGDLGDRFHSVRIFSEARQEYFDIVPGTITPTKVGQFFGETVMQNCLTSTGGAGLFQIINAISIAASKRGRVKEGNQIGAGVWTNEERDTLVLIGRQGLFRYDDNGGYRRERTSWFGEKCVRYVTDVISTPWFDDVKLADYTRKAFSSRDWCIGVLEEMQSLFAKWDNLTYGSDDQCLLSGLVMSIILQSIWEVRPHIFLSGPTDSGKSELLSVFEKMFGSIILRLFSPSEAAVRAAIKIDSCFVLLDEFEKSGQRVKIRELFRGGTKGGQSARSTSDQKVIFYRVNHLPVFVAVNRGAILSAADSNRVICIDLNKVPPEKRIAGQAIPDDVYLRDLGHRAIAVAVVHWRKALELEKKLGRISLEGIEHRLVECYAVPVAMQAAVLGLEAGRMTLGPSGEIEASGAILQLVELMENRGNDIRHQVEPDEERVMEYFLAILIHAGRESFPLCALSLMETPPPMSGLSQTGVQIAANHGIYRSPRSGDYVFDEKLMAKALVNTTFAGQHVGELLKRLGAERGSFWWGQGQKRSWRLSAERMAPFLLPYRSSLSICPETPESPGSDEASVFH